MTGRGIDQILEDPSDPMIHEEYVASALGYVELAEQVNGRISRSASSDYIWGDALAELEKRCPDARIINLETSITRSEEWEPKGINYRMSPGNLPCLQSLRVDCCALANNHILDWGIQGLRETLRTLGAAGIQFAGAGSDLHQASRPAEIRLQNGGRILFFSFGLPSSGIPLRWAAAEGIPGVFLLENLSHSSVKIVRDRISEFHRPGDRIIASIHWGSNWGYEVSSEQRRFAHELVDEVGVDLIHGHSSHHAQGFEVHSGKLILYGCGDFMNDYEGIGGYEEYRPDLSMMYFPALDLATGKLSSLEVIPMKIKRFRLERCSVNDLEWVRGLFKRECRGVSTLRVLTRSLLWSDPKG